MTTTNDVLVTGNEALQNALASILQRSITAVDAGVAFLSAEIPDVIQQLLMWHATQSLIFFLIGFAVVFFSLFILFYNCGRGEKLEHYYKTTWTHDKYGDFNNPLPYLGIGLIVLMFGIMMSSNMAWLQIWIAPKIFLIEYAASLVK